MSILDQQAAQLALVQGFKALSNPAADPVLMAIAENSIAEHTARIITIEEIRLNHDQRCKNCIADLPCAARDELWEDCRSAMKVSEEISSANAAAIRRR